MTVLLLCLLGALSLRSLLEGGLLVLWGASEAARQVLSGHDR